MTVPSRQADEALDRLGGVLKRARWTAFGAEDNMSELRSAEDDLATVRSELERLREELLFTARRPDDQEKIDAWWRARSEVKVDGNSRAEYVLQRDAAWERVESAEAELRQLREERDAWVASHIDKDKELWIDADEIGKLERSIQYERDQVRRLAEGLRELLDAFPMADPYSSLWEDYRKAQDMADPYSSLWEDYRKAQDKAHALLSARKGSDA